MNNNSLYPNEQYIVLDTIQALAADLSVANGEYKFGNPLVKLFDWDDLVSAKIQAPVAEVLQVTTLTPTAAANTVYSFYITQFDPANGNMRNWFYSYTSAASGDTATTIGDYFRTAINADTTIHIAATGAATLILTAETGYPIFKVGITSASTTISQSTGTAGVAAIGTTAQLTAAGYEGLAASATYTNVTLNVNQKTGYSLKNQQTLKTTWNLLINQGATNRAALVTALQETLGNLVIGLTVASVENEAKV